MQEWPFLQQNQSFLHSFHLLLFWIGPSETLFSPPPEFGFVSKHIVVDLLRDELGVIHKITLGIWGNAV